MATTKIRLGGQTDLDASGLNISNLADPSTAQQAATKNYVDNRFGAVDAITFKGVIDASTNPNYPAANAGDLYRISVAGKIGGASGPNVEVGDTILCLTDGTVTGDHATVGVNWNISQVNIDGAVTSTASSSVANDFAVFDGTNGRVIKTNGWSRDTDTTLAADSDTRFATQKAVKAYVDANSGYTAANFVDRETPAGTVNGSNVTFTLANTPIAGSEHVYLNGLLQDPGAGNDYTISTNTITYLTAPLTGDKIRVSYRK